MRRYIVLLLITGVVWAQTDFDKLILKDGTTYFGEYSKTEGKIVYFKPHDAFGFQPIPVKRIRRLELKDGQIFFNGGSILIAKKNSIHHKRRTKEKALYDAKLINLWHWGFYGPLSGITFAGFMFFEPGEAWDSPSSIAASLAIPYLILNLKKVEFSYPKSITHDDRLYYKKIYSNKLKQRKFIYIVGSTIVTGAVIAGIFLQPFRLMVMMPASTQTVDKIKFSKSILIPSSPALVGFFVCGMLGRFGYEMPFLFA